MAKRGTYNITPAEIAAMTDEEVKKTYQHYRYVANKRLARLKRAGYTQYEAYKQYKGKFAPASDLTPRQMRNRLAKTGAFLRMWGSTVREIQRYEKNMIKQLHDKGYTFINKKNLPEFGRFMDKVRDRWGSKVLDSDRVVQMFQYREEIKISEDQFIENIDLFMEEEASVMEEIEQLMEEAAAGGASQAAINRMIEKRTGNIAARINRLAGTMTGELSAEWGEKRGRKKPEPKKRSRQRRKKK